MIIKINHCESPLITIKSPLITIKTPLNHQAMVFLQVFRNIHRSSPLRDCRDQQRQGGQKVGERRSRLLHQQQATNGLLCLSEKKKTCQKQIEWNYDGLQMFINVY